MNYNSYKKIRGGEDVIANKGIVTHGDDVIVASVKGVVVEAWL